MSVLTRSCRNFCQSSVDVFTWSHKFCLFACLFVLLGRFNMFQFAILDLVACFNNVYVTNWSKIVLCRPMRKFSAWKTK